MAVIKGRYSRPLSERMGRGRSIKNIPKGWISLLEFRERLFKNWGIYLDNKAFHSLANRKIIVADKFHGGAIIPVGSIAAVIAYEHPSFAKEAKNLEAVRAKLIEANNKLSDINEEHYMKKISISELETKISNERGFFGDAARSKKLEPQLGKAKKELALISSKFSPARETVGKLGLEFNRLQSEIDRLKKKEKYG